MHRIKLRHVNNVLFIATVGVLLYVITAPVLPTAFFWLEKRTGSRLGELSSELQLPAKKVAAMPEGNRIVIPSMLLEAPIHEGRDLSALHHGGTWRRPNASSPEKGGNTVIVAHRFTYSNPRGTFYFLDKVKVGDDIGVFWKGKRHLYKVTSTKVVPPTQAEVEAPSKQNQLTLYTCTPLWMPKDRLVVIAEELKP
jgi:LPXTG-site transpeptidase (sortase) family protein